MLDYFELNTNKIMRDHKFNLELVKKAGEIMMNVPENFETVNKSIVGDIVTQRDIEIDKFLIDEISKKYPTDSFITEETHNNKADWEKADGPTWIIDPIDGTVAYRYSGGSHTSISAAFADGGEILQGYVYNPFTDELYEAQKGKGSKLNGKKITTKDERGFPICVANNNYVNDDMINIIKTFQKVDPEFWLWVQGSAALSLAEVGAGRQDLHVHNFLKPWDMAAGRLIAEEAGAKVCDFKGNPLKISTTEIVCGHERLVDKFLEVWD